VSFGPGGYDVLCKRVADHFSGSLIYEYIGEVIAEKTFRKRMQQYAEEGIRHFYFMMLQKEEVSDLFLLLAPSRDEIRLR
jgi:hypothetical protein